MRLPRLLRIRRIRFRFAEQQLRALKRLYGHWRFWKGYWDMDRELAARDVADKDGAR